MVDLVLDSLKKWREELINLAKSNRLLYFRHTKSATLEITEPPLAEVLSGIQDRGKTGWSFYFPPEVDDEGRTSSRTRNSNELLTQKPDRTSLQTALRNLERRATQEYMDKGLWILYLGIGMLEWTDPVEEEETAASPLLLMPVSLTRPSPRDPFRLLRADQDPVINPALSVKMLNDFGVVLPTLDDLEELNVDSLFDQVAHAVADHPDWKIQRRVVLGTFSFHKEVMYRDLLDNESAIAGHELVRALAMGAKAEISLDFEPVPEDELDELHPPEESVAILDADASQRQCIAAAKDGRTFVMDGPPGTGKSQTIANLIAELLVDGKTVLLVSEKAAALEVVYKRLAEAGLDEYLLELHSYKATRKKVAQELGRALATHPKPGTKLSSTQISNLKARRAELSDYAQAMNETRRPLDRSLHDVLGRVSELYRLPHAPIAKAISADLDPGHLTELMDRASALSRAWAPVDRQDNFHWREVLGLELSGAKIQELQDAANSAVVAVENLQNLAITITSNLGVRWSTTDEEARRLLELLELALERPDIPDSWLSAPDFSPIKSRIEQLRAIADSHQHTLTGLNTVLGPSWRDLSASLNHLVTQSSETAAELRPSWTPDPSTNQTRMVEIAEFLENSIGDLQFIQKEAPQIAGSFSLPSDSLSLARAMDLAELGGAIGAPESPEPEWINPSVLIPLKEASRVLRTLVTTYQAKKAELDDIFTEDILGLDDLSGLAVRFETVHKGVGKFKAQYRRDKATLQPFTRTKKVTSVAVASLRTAVEWQRLTKELTHAEEVHSAVLGTHYYRHVETNFEAVTNAIEVVERALAVAGDYFDSESLKRQLGRGGTPDLQIPSIANKVLEKGRGWIERATYLLPELSSDLPTMPFEEVIDWCAKAGAASRSLGDSIHQVEVIKGTPSTLGETQSVSNGRALIDSIELEMQRTEDSDRSLLGDLYTKLDTDWGELSTALDWALEVRRICGSSMTSRVAKLLLTTELQPEELRIRFAARDKAVDQLISKFQTERGDELRADLSTTFQDAVDLLREMAGSTADIGVWVAFVQHREFLMTAGLEPAVTFCVNERVRATDVAGVIEKAILEGWIDDVMKSDKRLRALRAADRDHHVGEFRDLDRSLIQTSVNRVIEACNQKRPRSTLGAAGIIQSEANKKRRHRPIRTLLADTTSVAQSLKPCFMMSPLTVSQFLPPTMVFDVVIFDEASQVRPSDSINCIYRGRQLIVAGDEKQLPPTAFFEKIGLDEGDEYVEDQLEEFESILHLCKGIMKSLSLRWHYRSQHEGLITFSNYSFYEGRLITFPGAVQEGPDVGVAFFKTEGVYRRGGPRDNPLEAAKVVERVLYHARSHPKLSLGVVAFSEAQAGAIETELEKQRLNHPELDHFFTDDRLSGFFVKNLENVQGDERDIIIFSIGYGYDEAGKFTLQFGPINKSGGQRRLNVAVTRARQRVEVVASITAGDFRGDMTQEGVRHLKRYLDFAERGLPALALDVSSSGRDVESPFEASVAEVIRSWGYDVVPQVGVADYRIDLGVVDPNHPGNFVLGIECDGVMYHSSKVARDRDRLRQDVLERLKWRLHRIWGTAWYGDREQQEIRLRDAIEDAIHSGGRRSLPGQQDQVPHDRLEFESINLDQTPNWAVSYRVGDATSKDRFWQSMHDPGAKPEIKRLIDRIVGIEGPVAEELVLRRVREAWGIGRAGSRARGAFDAALSELIRAGKVIRDGEGFLWLPGQVLPGVRVAAVDDPSTRRKVSEVPRAELELAIRKTVIEARFISWGELSTYVARLFGWNRRGPDITLAIDGAIEELIEGGALRRSNDHLEPSTITDLNVSESDSNLSQEGMIICPGCGMRNRVPKDTDGSGLRCGDCHSPLPS